MMQDLSRTDVRGKVTLGGNICLDPSDETEENLREDAEYLTFIKIAKQEERPGGTIKKEVNEAPTDVFHHLRKILMSCNNEEEDNEGNIHHGGNASLVVNAETDEERSHDGDSQGNPKKDAEVRSMNKTSRHEASSVNLLENDNEIVTDVFHKLRKILISCTNEEEDSDGSSHCNENTSLNVEAGPGEELQPKEEESPCGEDSQENPEEDGGVRTLSKTSKEEEERLEPSLEDGDDDAAIDMFHKLREILMSCNNEEEDNEESSHHDEKAASLDVEADPDEEWQPKEETNSDDGETHGEILMSCNNEEKDNEESSHHDEKAASLDVEADPDEEWQPKEETNSDDGETHDKEDEDGSHCSKGADIIDEVGHTRTTRKKPLLKYQCGHCEKRFRLLFSLKAHEKIHARPKIYKCRYCEKCFELSESRISHERTHTGENPYECQHCAKTFATYSGCRRHKLYRCQKASYERGYSVTAVNNQDSNNVDESMQSLKKPYLCHCCGKSFVTLRACKNHIDLHTSGKFVFKSRPCKCEHCGKYFQCPSELVDHVRRHTGEKPFSCNICGKAFADKTHLRNHGRIHTGERPYECDICNKSFTWQRSWRRHKQWHEGITPGRGNVHFKSCPHCGKNYDRKHLQRHIRRVHEKLKPYKCQVCEKCFASNGDLRKHKVTHSGVKDHQCSFCGKLFGRAATCRNHEMLRHKREKPKYSCQYCGKVYTIRNFLEPHEKRHFAEKKYYACESCGQKYTSSWSLKMHQRTHTGEKPYQCHICHKSFIRKYYRDRHVKTHKDK